MFGSRVTLVRHPFDPERPDYSLNSQTLVACRFCGASLSAACRSCLPTANGDGSGILTMQWCVLFIVPAAHGFVGALMAEWQVINTGDMMDFFTGGFYKPTIHRVVQPPADQRAYDRVGVFYFTVVDDDVRLLPLTDSPVLERVGIERRCPDEEAPLSDAWRKERTISYGRIPLKKGTENTEEELVGGIVVKHYN